MNSVSYVSSEADKMKQSKLNNVITSLKDYVSCTTPDSTIQDFGTLEYEGTICLGQVIKGNKKPRATNVPIISDNNVFLGYMNENGNLTVSNVKQICNSNTSLNVTGTGVAIICNGSIPECDVKCTLSCTCCMETRIEKNLLTNITTTCITDCCIICENTAQCLKCIVCGGVCRGCGCTTLYRRGEYSEEVYAVNCVWVAGTPYQWTSPTLIIFDYNAQKILHKCNNSDFINECLACCGYRNFYAVMSENKNGLDFELTLNCTFVDTVTYATTDSVSIYERYV